jgi:hypothetical protein
MRDPRSSAAAIEAHPELPPGNDERFAGYGVMAQPFASGHVLALRRFAATSVGPAYTAIWHRAPNGRWTFRITGEPFQCCNRYFGSAVDETIQDDIALAWSGPWQLTVTTADDALRWTMIMAATPITRALSATGGVIPAALWRQPIVPAMTGAMAGGLLRTEHMAMHGDVPNGQRFLVNPPQLWAVTGSQATLDGVDLGPTGPLQVQDHLEDFWLPQRGLFYSGTVQFETYDESRHRLVANRPDALERQA